MSPPSSHTHQVEHLEDFTKHEWCNTLLSDPSVTKIQKRSSPSMNNGDVSNSFFTKTLFTDDAVRAFLSMYRPGRGRANNIADAEAAGDALLGDKEQGEVDGRREEERTKLDSQADLDEPEALILVSLGKNVDGGIKRLHGGITATLLDQVMGILISYSHENTSATAELTIKYKKPIETPCVLLCRARIVREAGRWIETIGWVEDGYGTIFAEGSGAFVKSRVKGQPDTPKARL